MESPVKAFPILHPAASVPPNPIINPPRNRRGNSSAAGTCQRTIPFDCALSQLPNGTPSSIKAPQVNGLKLWSSTTRRRLRLGPIIDNPQCQPPRDPTTHASAPNTPRIKPVRYQGQISGDDGGFVRNRKNNPIRATLATTTHAALTPRSFGSVESETGPANSRSRKWRKPCSVSHAPTASPNTAVPAPTFPVPTRDQIEVAQPLAHTIPKPNVSPPTIEASQVRGTEGTRMSWLPARAFTPIN